jgi:hypothetical protein
VIATDIDELERALGGKPQGGITERPHRLRGEVVGSLRDSTLRAFNQVPVKPGAAHK